jgi:short-subunit dehydrogenase
VFARHPYVVADLRRPDAAAEALARAVGEAPLDVLVHMAATGSFCLPWEEGEERVREQVAVNLEAPIAITRALLPALLAARGRIAFVSSVASAHACPDYAVYAATKAALDGFARSLAAELSGRASVVVVHPGATATRIHVKSGVPAALLEGRRWPTADRVAGGVLRAIDGRARRRAIGWGNAFAHLAGRRLERVVDALARRGRR